MMWLFWRLIPHSHGTDNMIYQGMYNPGMYQIYECRKCRMQEAL